MPLMQWNSRYRTGIEAADQEHQVLIELINRLHDDWRLVRKTSSVAELLDNLVAALSAHFKFEEGVMRNHNYDLFTAHAKDHNSLIEDIRSIEVDIERDGSSVLAECLEVWFARHIVLHDARLYQTLASPINMAIEARAPDNGQRPRSLH